MRPRHDQRVEQDDYRLTVLYELLHGDDAVLVGVETSENHLHVGLHVLMGVLLVVILTGRKEVTLN